MKTIDAMKQIRDKLIAGDLLCEVVAVSMLGEAIAAEEAQTEPYDQQALEPCDTCGWKAIVPGEPCLVCARNAKMLEQEQEQEPVAYVNADGFIIEKGCLELAWGTKIYARPQPVAELTDDEIIEIFLTGTNHVDSMQFARAVLAAQKAKS